MQTTPPRRAWVLVLPTGLIFLVLLAGPLAMLVDESLRPFESGRIGGLKGAGLTLHHYRELFEPAYYFFFFDTFRIGFIVAVVAVLLGFPIAYYVARQRDKRIRKACIALLIGTLFLSLIVRVYAVLMAFGPIGPLKGVAWLFGTEAESAAFAAVQVGIGLLHTLLPLASLILIGTVQNVNPRLEDAAQSLGAPRWRAFLSVTVALSLPGIMSAFLLSYAFCISNFVVPLILGKGIVLFIANLIYIRFSEVNNFPSGAAISIIMVVVSLLMVYALTSLVRARWKGAGAQL